MQLLKHPWLQLLALLIIAGFIGWIFHDKTKPIPISVNSFAECVAAGYPVSGSTPPTCQVPNGKTFTSPAPQDVIVKGEIVCLPHKDKKGPQTLECAYGLKTKTGKYYALRDTSSNYANLTSKPNGSNVTIHGTLEVIPGTKYDTVGVISISSIQ
ncbi:MAG TPA: hypothetical protein VG917_00660 [Patescibacteria group bacterium]|nr:hypothetical protein [Patescibacteria group bacterium]